MTCTHGLRLSFRLPGAMWASRTVGDFVAGFTQYKNEDVRSLIEEYPLAWVCSGGGADMEASLLPLIGRYDEEGRLVELIGHMMRINPLHRALTADQNAVILFKGPDAYVSPEHAQRRDWAPTWNYAQLKVVAQIGFDDSLTEYALELLLDAMEAGRVQPWSAAELGDRYADMLEHIIGFRANVAAVSGVFKLGQDEHPATLSAIVNSVPDPATAGWMRRHNGGRI